MCVASPGAEKRERGAACCIRGAFGRVDGGGGAAGLPGEGARGGWCLELRFCGRWRSGAGGWGMGGLALSAAPLSPRMPPGAPALRSCSPRARAARAPAAPPPRTQPSGSSREPLLERPPPPQKLPARAPLRPGGSSREERAPRPAGCRGSFVQTHAPGALAPGRAVAGQSVLHSWDARLAKPRPLIRPGWGWGAGAWHGFGKSREIGETVTGT